MNSIKIVLNTFILSILLFSCSNTAGKKVAINIDGIENGTVLITSNSIKEPVSLKESGSIKVKIGSLLSIKPEGNTGYEFEYWDGIDTDLKDLYFTANENINITANFYHKKYQISSDSVNNGKITISPLIENDKLYPANTVFTVNAEPDDGYVVDSVYYSLPGRWGIEYIEELSDKTTFKLTTNISFGASFIPKSDTRGFTVIDNIIYAKPGVKKLKYDLYKPNDNKKHPLVVIIHGGGWSSNDEDIMRGMAREFVKTGNFVVASVDYRWIGHLDGDLIENTALDLIEDVYGAIAHIIEHSSEYSIDSSKLYITGDSAGGHLAASVATMVERLGQKQNGINPTYIPEGMKIEEFKSYMENSLKAVAPSYGVFLTEDLKTSPAGGDSTVSPYENIPLATKRVIPHYLLRGSKDPIIKDSSLKKYVKALEEAGQPVTYSTVKGAGHAFFDWKPDESTKDTFKEFGITYIKDVIDFFNFHV